MSSCCVVSPSQSRGFSSIFTHGFLIFWVRTWNSSGTTGTQTQQDRISLFFLAVYIRVKGKQGSSTGEAPLGPMVVQVWTVPSPLEPEQSVMQVIVPTGDKDTPHAMTTKLRAGISPNLNWKEHHGPQEHHINAFRAKKKQIWTV